MFWGGVFAFVLGGLQYLYCDLSRAWVPYGGTSVQLLRLEFPLFLVLAWLSYLPMRKRGWRWLSWPLAALPVLVLYILLDGFYLGLHRGARFSDWKNLGALLGMSPRLGYAALGLLALALLVPALRWGWGWKAMEAGRRRRSLLLRGLVLLGLGGFFASGLLRVYMEETMPFVSWSETRNLQLNGRLSSVFHDSFRRAATLEKLQKLKVMARATPRFQGSIPHKRNLHILVLESFLDPRLVEGIRIRGEALAPALASILSEGGTEEFDRVETPIYGGSTPQTEFEVLTGLPALALAESVEFNLMEGGAISSLCAALKRQGYHCVATIATPPQFFNSVLAYKSLGFDEVHFLGGPGYLEEVPGDPWIFDGDLLSQNLAFLEARFLSKKKPILNYILGSYGHLPFERNLKKRPDLCSLEDGSAKSPELHRILNQFRYRTHALARFIQAIRDQDPNSLLYLTSDHLPAIFGRDLRYSLDDKVNVSLLLDRGKRIPLPKLPSYALPYHLWSRLSGRLPRIPPREALKRGYLQALSESLDMGGSLGK